MQIQRGESGRGGGRDHGGGEIDDLRDRHLPPIVGGRSDRTAERAQEFFRDRYADRFRRVILADQLHGLSLSVLQEAGDEDEGGRGEEASEPEGREIGQVREPLWGDWLQERQQAGSERRDKERQGVRQQLELRQTVEIVEAEFRIHHRHPHQG